MTQPQIICAYIITFHDDPQYLAEKAVTQYPKGALVTSAAGKIIWVGDKSDLPQQYVKLPITDYNNQYLMAGFIDPHLHFPQYRMLAAPGKNLLDWLTRFTFKEEARYVDAGHATDAAEHFLDFLLAHGTTSAMAFSSVHKGATDILFNAADKRNMAFFTGKTMMDRNAPDNVLDQAEQGAIDSEVLLQKWHGHNRLRYAITPRFAITSTEAQLQLTGELYQKYPDCYMQTHLSESAEEIEMVKNLFPNAKDYTAVYEQYDLLQKNSFFGHAIHLSERECAALSQAQSTVVHCPTSNTFLGSGLFNLGHLRQASRPIDVGLATDIGGGTSYSMLHTIGEAFKVASFNNISFSALEGFYMATLGNAKTLGLDHEIGSVKVGNWADFIIIDPVATPLLAARQQISESLNDALFALAILGDDRAISATYVAGECLHTRT
ncbi:MAG: guanine deaminase [Hyphomicrobiales bacterium]|nr:guanine deaminase [Hyphomicrobiales bacterium]